MNQEMWSAVDSYLVETFVGADAALDAALKASEAAGLPHINVAPNQGKLLHLLAKVSGAKRILEIGTLGGYSAIWLARALPSDGKLTTLEFDPKHAKVARENLARAGFANQVEVIEGKALDSLPKLTGPFDFIFIDADKSNIPAYFEWSLKLARPGSVIIVDNVIRDGRIIDTSGKDASVEGVRKFNAMVRAESRVSATAIQTVGSKGYDGFCLVRVK